MFRFFMAMALALGAVSAASAQRIESNAWTLADGRLALESAGISLPVEAGDLSLRAATEFGNRGEGIDNGAQYRTRDGEIVGTVYVYYPGLTHSGLSAFATDNAIRSQSGKSVRHLSTSIVGAGGSEGAAIRADYSGYLEQRLASSAAFVKVGRWIVKIRVSGPSGRQRDVERGMTALLDGIRFGSDLPRPAAPLQVGDCPGGSPPPATVLADPTSDEAILPAFLATLDGAGGDVTTGNGEPGALPSRVPERFCVSRRIALQGGGDVPVLRAEEGPALSPSGRTVMLVPLGDNGTTVEVVHSANLGRYVMLHHRIGATSVLASYDSAPSDDQIARLVTGADDDAGRPRAEVEFRPGRGPQINLMDGVPRAPET